MTDRLRVGTPSLPNPVMSVKRCSATNMPAEYISQKRVQHIPLASQASGVEAKLQSFCSTMDEVGPSASWTFRPLNLFWHMLKSSYTDLSPRIVHAHASLDL